MNDRLAGWRLDIFMSVALFGLAFIVFLPALGHDFVNYDDPLYVTENWLVQRGLTAEGFVEAFSSFEVSNWHPLTWLSHMADCELYGLNPMGHHATSIFLHALNTAILGLVLSRMTGHRWPAFFVGVLFGLHPLHVESVAWVAERKDVLCTFFGLLSVGAYGLYARKHSVGRYGLVLFFMALSLMAKPMFVTLPCVLLLLDLWPLKRMEIGGGFGARFVPLLLEKAPLFILSAASSVVTIAAQRSGGALRDFDVYPFSVRIANALLAYTGYLVKTIWPVGLVVHYPHARESISYAASTAAGLLLLAITVCAIVTIRRRPYLFVGWFWYLGTAVPVIGVIQVGSQSMADRYTYVPLIGIFMAAAWLVYDVVEKKTKRLSITGLVGLLLAGVLCPLTVAQVRHWRTSESLFTHSLTVHPESALAHENLASYYLGVGDVTRAEMHLLESLRLDPSRVLTSINLGILWGQRGRFEEAASHLDRALAREPGNSAALYNLGIVRFGQEQHAEAARLFQSVLAQHPMDSEARYYLGLALLESGKPGAAREQFEGVLEDTPEREAAWTSLGVALIGEGRIDDAVDHFEKMLLRFPDNADAAAHLEHLRGVKAEGEL